MAVRCHHVLALGLVTACGSSLHRVPSGAHRVDEAQAVVVGFPAPPARVECVPKRPREECAWLDGTWRWGGRRWQWTPGAWVVPPAGCYYAPAYFQWVSGEGVGSKMRDQLFFFEARWYATQGAAACPPPEVCAAAEFGLEC